MARIKAKHRGKIDGIKKGQASTNPDRIAKNKNFRTRATINRLNMYKNGGKPIRNCDGKIIKEAEYQSKLKSGTQARVEPNRKWFGNTRVIGQESLQKFQESLASTIKNPFMVVMKPSKLPLTLLDAKAVPGKESIHILDTESYKETFSQKRRRKRPNITAENVAEVIKSADDRSKDYDIEKDMDLEQENDGTQEMHRNPLLNAGQSKRIWRELYRVLDSADVIIQVLDARDPQGTRCRHIERYLEKEKPHKHLIFLLNKVDLQPISVTRRWIAILQKERPTLAFKSSITKPFGKGALISLLRQFAILHKDKKSISVGFIGYPNVGKSSAINTMKSKKVCNVAPVPGETKVWQFIAMTKRIFLIDCPGVVYSGQEQSETELILRSVCRVENIYEPQSHIHEVLRRAKHEHLARLYQITGWESDESGIEFLEQLAHARGKLLKGGEPDVNSVARTVLRDWQYGKIPYLTQPDVNININEDVEKKENEETNELDNQQRDEMALKRIEIESQLTVEQELDGLVTVDMDDQIQGEDEWSGDDEDEVDDAVPEKTIETGSTSNGTAAIDEADERTNKNDKPVAEIDIIKAKLAKVRKAMKAGFLQRGAAVQRNIERREKLENQVDLTKVVREINREEEKEKAKERKLQKFDDEVEKPEEPSKPTEVQTKTSKERRAAVNKEKLQKGKNYYSTANVKNKNRNKIMKKV